MAITLWGRGNLPRYFPAWGESLREPAKGRKSCGTGHEQVMSKELLLHANEPNACAGQGAQGSAYARQILGRDWFKIRGNNSGVSYAARLTQIVSAIRRGRGWMLNKAGEGTAWLDARRKGHMYSTMANSRIDTVAFHVCSQRLEQDASIRTYAQFMTI